MLPNAVMWTFSILQTGCCMWGNNDSCVQVHASYAISISRQYTFDKTFTYSIFDKITGNIQFITFKISCSFIRGICKSSNIKNGRFILSEVRNSTASTQPYARIIVLSILRRLNSRLMFMTSISSFSIRKQGNSV